MRGICRSEMRLMEKPLTITRPEVGTTSPVSSLMMVDLPEPEGPTRNANSPSSTVKDTPFRACVPLSYIFSASIKRIITLLLFVKMQHLVACFELLSLYINGYKMATGKI